MITNKIKYNNFLDFLLVTFVFPPIRTFDFVWFFSSPSILLLFSLIVLLFILFKGFLLLFGELFGLLLFPFKLPLFWLLSFPCSCSLSWSWSRSLLSLSISLPTSPSFSSSLFCPSSFPFLPLTYSFSLPWNIFLFSLSSPSLFLITFEPSSSFSFDSLLSSCLFSLLSSCLFSLLSSCLLSLLPSCCSGFILSLLKISLSFCK